MKILYKQSSEAAAKSSLSALNITNCYLKEITGKNDYNKTTFKPHFHGGYELHAVFRGEQRYEADGAVYEVRENEFILIPPKLKHRTGAVSEELLKYSITFNSDAVLCDSCCHGSLSEPVMRNIAYIAEEYGRRLPFSALIIENRTAETLALLLRMMGHKEGETAAEVHSENDRLELAKKFISDNIGQSLSVSEVSAYCHVSARQLSRLFRAAEGVSTAQYINKERMKRISECIKNSDMSLRQISERFSYNNEYYFNTAFKKHFGMPPSAYRKSFR